MFLTYFSEKKKRTASFDERIETNIKSSGGENQRGKFNRFQAEAVIKRYSKNRYSAPTASWTSIRKS